MTIAEDSLKMHEEKRGKIEVISRVPVKTKEDYLWPILLAWRSRV
jgi:hypothetical protein